MAVEKVTAYRISAEDATAQAWASAQRNASASIAQIKGMIPGLSSALSAAGFISIVKGSIDAMDHLNDLSKTTGLTVEALAGLKMAAKQSGGDLDSIAASVNKLAVEMGKAPEKFRELGITARDPLEAFKQLADIFNSIEDPQQRAAVAAAALGKSWAGAAPLLSEGSKKIGEMVAEGTKLSGVTTEMAVQADELNDKWLQLVGSGGLINSIAGKMLPPLLLIADAMITLKDETSGWIAQLEKLPQLPAFPLLTAARLLMEANAAEKNGMTLGSGPAGGRANVDRIKPDESAAAAKKFLGSDKESLAEQKTLAREIEQFNKEVEAAQQVALTARMKQLDEIREAELNAAREHIELDREIAAHNKEVEAAEAEAMAARQRQLDDEAAGIAKGRDAADSLRSASELENMAYAERLANLKLYLESANLSQAESNAILAQMQVEHEANLGSISAQAAVERRKFAQLNAMQQAQSYIGILTNLTASTAAKNREMFEINKVASIANAIMYTYEGANKAIAQGGIFGLGMAAIIIAAGLANVAQIASTTFGSGVAPSAGGGGAGVTPVNQVPTVPQSTGPTTLVQLTGGDFYSEESVRKLLERIAETKGGRVVLV